MAKHLAEIPVEQIRRALEGRGLVLDLGAARVRVRSDVETMAPLIQTVYRGYEFDDSDALCDVTAKLRYSRGLRRYLRRQVEFLIDGTVDFAPFADDTPLPLLEWGMNYAIAQRSSWCLLLHAGVVERDGRAVVLPAMPGAGKSTLTAALATRGFRLFSDEFGVVRFQDSRLLPLLRPIALKNESIEVIQRFAPGAVLGPRFPKTHKGTVAHLAPEPAHVAARHIDAEAALVIFPRFVADTGVHLEAVSKGQAFARMALNSFNYEFLGALAFDALGRVIEGSNSYQLRYGSLEGAVTAILELLE
jgi:HprK-related kinase A